MSSSARESCSGGGSPHTPSTLWILVGSTLNGILRMRTTRLNAPTRIRKLRSSFGRRGREEHRRVDVFEQAQMFALVERVDVVDEDEVRSVDHVPVAVDRQQHGRTDDDAHAAVAQPFFGLAAVGRRRSAVNLADAQARAFEPVGEIGDVLADQVAGRREDDDVAVAGAESYRLRRAASPRSSPSRSAPVSRNSCFPSSRAALISVIGGALVVGEREAFSGLNQFVGGGDGLTVGVDVRPDVGRGRKGYASDNAPAS